MCWYSATANACRCTSVQQTLINKCRIQQEDKYEQARCTYLHSPKSLLLSLAVLARFTHTGLSWLAAGRAGELSSVFLFLLVSFAPFLGVLLALAGSSSDTSPLPACFPFFFASAPFLLPPPLDATCLLGGFLLLGDGPLACREETTHSLRSGSIKYGHERRVLISMNGMKAMSRPLTTKVKRKC